MHPPGIGAVHQRYPAGDNARLIGGAMKTLLLVILMLLVATVAMADHIGIYTDATGSSCQLSPGFNTTATIIHKFATGATSSIFKVSTANAPGSIIFSLPFGGAVCVVDPCPFLYFECKTGSIVLGTLTAMLGSSGYIEVVGAGSYPQGDFPVPLVGDCSQGLVPATGGRAYLGSSPGTCDPALPTEASTWGSVKALYR